VLAREEMPQMMRAARRRGVKATSACENAAAKAMPFQQRYDAIIARRYAM